MQDQNIVPITTTKDIALLAVNDMVEEGVDTSLIIPELLFIVGN